MITLALRWLLAGALLMASSTGFALEDIKIGILAYRPKAQVQAQWEPLAEALNQRFPEHKFNVKAMTFDEMAFAVASRQVDFILSNPSHYILMASHAGLSAPLATLISLEHGMPITSFGGVIFTNAADNGIRRLQDVRGHSVATASTNSLGGYQMQAFEFAQAGLELTKDTRLMEIGMPQDKVVEAVMRGEANVGLVRSGLLEKLVDEGKLDMNRIVIVNRQELPGFPVAVSTRLYPEWLLAAVPNIDNDLSRKVVSFLLNVEDNQALTKALGIHGFDVPSDYTSVEGLLRELRMPPFDRAPPFSAMDVWARYHWQILLFLLAGAALVALGINLALTNRRLRAEKERVQQQAQALAASELRFRTVANYTHDWEYWQGPDHQILFMSPSCERITGYTHEEFSRDPSLLKRIIHPEDVAGMHRHLHDANSLQGCEEAQFRIIRRDGEIRWLSHVCQAVFDDGGQLNGRRVSNRDITERKRADEDRLASEEKLSTILDSVNACIYLKDMQGHYLYGNRSVRELWQLQMQDIIGYGDEKFFDEATTAIIRANDRRVLDNGETIKTEDVNRLRSTGQTTVFHTTKLPLRRPDGSIYALCGISTDISDIRKTHEALQASLKEKTALLNEVHHRVKNNLQVITSLLRMEARRSSQTETKTVLVEMQGRIRSMALLHESLYRSGIFASVDLGAYLRQLATQAFRAQAAQDGAITLQLELSPVHVSMDQATPCGLLVNELVSNCLKHGFPDGKRGEVHIKLQAQPDADGGSTWVNLIVRDTGVGLPVDLEVRLSKSLGLQLASDLARQLGGTLEFGAGPGAELSVRFRISQTGGGTLSTLV